MTTYIRKFICVDPYKELPFISDTEKRSVIARNNSLKRTVLHHKDNGWIECASKSPNVLIVKKEI